MESGSWKDVWYADRLIHLPIMASIVFGTFQGYLKDRIAGGLPYALADGMFLLAVLAWLGTIAVRNAPLRGPGATVSIIVTIIVVPIVYFLFPGATLLVRMAGLRSWILFPMAALIAMSAIRTVGQVRAYIGLLMILCVITALYGIRQYFAGPEVLLDIGELAQLRHGSTLRYVLGSGRLGFRAFSTFTFPGPFAAMMVFGILLAAGTVTSKLEKPKTRWMYGFLIPLFFIGLTVSGTRAALIILALGLVTLFWYRRLTLVQMLLVPFGIIAVHLTTVFAAGQLLDRFRTLLVEEGLFWLYVSAPIKTALEYLAEHPFGIGLGRTGIGVPFAITQRMPTDYFVFTDGDVGRAAVEMGLLGLVIILLIVVVVVLYAPPALRTLRGSSADATALGIGPLLIASAVGISIGSPLSSIPHGLIWWFLFGALMKLAMMRSQELAAPDS